MYKLTLKFGESAISKSYNNAFELYDEIREVINEGQVPGSTTFNLAIIQMQLNSIIKGGVEEASYANYRIEFIKCIPDEVAHNVGFKVYRLKIKFGRVEFVKDYQSILCLYGDLIGVIREGAFQGEKEYNIRVADALIERIIRGDINKAIHEYYEIELITAEYDKHI